MNTYHINTVHMSLFLYESSELECFERSNAIEIRNGIMLDFYPGLPHMEVAMWTDTALMENNHISEPVLKSFFLY